MTEHIYNIYCDESCHLENDNIPVMVLGGTYCRAGEVKRISRAIRELKLHHGLAPDFEVKWTKVSRGKLDFYRTLVALFLQDDALCFRGVLIPDKAVLDHERFGQNHDEWYYKMYYTMLRYVFTAPNRYRVYLDIKDTRGGHKTRHLHDVLCNSLYDFNHETVVRVQQVRSHESELLQLTDLLIGAIAYENRGLTGSEAKLALISDLKAALGPGVLSQTTAFQRRKFNLLRWQASGGDA
ncbi:MAG: DUF3800 domain-containing protein [Alphaproteobacteria bacterium]|nr:DUF3800 domain-containing protein [Alphaproteobacteria bacterium]